MSPSPMPGLVCEESWCVCVHGTGELHRYKSHSGYKTLWMTFMYIVLHEELLHEELLQMSYFVGVFLYDFMMVSCWSL